MKGVGRIAGVLAIVALMALAFSACGSSDSDDSSSASSTATAESTAPADDGAGSDQATQQSGDDSGGEGSAAFRTPGGDNSIQDFGEEAAPEDREAAEEALTAYFDARAEDDWETECDYLTKSTIDPLVQLAQSSPQFKGKDCAAILEALSSGTPTSTRANVMVDGLASLRLAENNRGFALFHGPNGVDYFVPIAEEDGEWKLGAVAPSEFP